MEPEINGGEYIYELIRKKVSGLYRMSKVCFVGQTNYGAKFVICSNTGNIVFLEPRKEKKVKGRGWIYHDVSGCGLYRKEETAETTKIEKPKEVKYAIWIFAQRSSGGNR